jgi:hypothetical protein
MHMVSVHGFANQYHSHQKKRQRVSPGEVTPDYIGASVRWEEGVEMVV